MLGRDSFSGMGNGEVLKLVVMVVMVVGIVTGMLMLLEILFEENRKNTRPMVMKKKTQPKAG